MSRKKKSTVDAVTQKEVFIKSAVNGDTMTPITQTEKFVADVINKESVTPKTHDEKFIKWAIENSSGETPVLIEKTITANGEYNASSDNADGYSSVTVNVSGGDDSFAKMVDRSITTANIPEGVTKIGGYAFFGCIALANVNFPSSLSAITGGSNFQSCTSLASVDLSATTVTSIPSRAFQDCQLENVDLPATVTSIGQYAFYQVSGSTKRNFTCRATTPPSIEANSLNGLNTRHGKIYVPAESVEAYKAAANWSNYASYITAIT